VLYSSIDFVLLLPLVLGLYWAVRGQRGRLLVLLAASHAFYAYASVWHVPVLLAVTGVGYVGGLLLGRWPRHGHLILTIGVGLLLGNLALFKYAVFVGESIDFLVPGLVDVNVWRLALPLGISFFTFEVIAYLADVRAGRSAPQPSLLRFGLYVAFFPHLIAGPIVRPAQLFPQLDTAKQPRLALGLFGAQTFLEGLLKKALLADPAGAIADRVFAAPGTFDTVSVWVGVLAYTIQIWADFSGYTDMGRGVARMLGYELPRNFLSPYLATSPRDFWRRWHITLSTWLRDYLYIPLGGNRRGAVRTAINLFVTMLLGGLWHGANWTFVAWGGYHGLLLLGQHGWARWGPRPRVPTPAAIGLTFLAVLHGWILFRAQSFEVFLEVLGRMYHWQEGATSLVRGEQVLVVLLAAAMFAGMAVATYRPRLVGRVRDWGIAQGALAGTVALAIFYLASRGARPFIYFQF
jgi:alginate O-acetyltransferase complex protein AlgI